MTFSVDQNVAIVMVAAINVVGLCVPAWFAYLAARNAKAAAESSRSNAINLETIKGNTNGMAHQLVETTRVAGEAKAQVEHYRGAEEQRAKGEEKAASVAETALAAVAVAASSMPPEGATK